MSRPSLTLVALILTCCGEPRFDPAAETERIRAIDREWLEASANHDIDAMMTVYLPDALQLIANMPPVVGHDSIEAFFRSLHIQYPRFRHYSEAQTITIAQSGEIAVVTGSYRFVPDSLHAAVDDVGKFVSVWKRQKGQWHLAIDISNSDRPPSTHVQ